MILQSENIWLGGRFMPAQLEICGAKITRVLRHGELPPDYDFGSLRILPGFIDIHTHGAYGFDTLDANPDGLKKWARQLPAEGVTAFLPTTATQAQSVIEKALQNVAAVASENCGGAEILGVHLEGPFIAKSRKGAHAEEYIAKPSVEKFKEYQDAANGIIKIVTLAPEEDENLTLTRFCANNGVAVSLGHTDATCEQAYAAIANGAKSVTHTYNAMSPLNHRAPGLVGAAYTSRGAFAELICDGVHVHPQAMRALFAAKENGRVVMVTDSLGIKGIEGPFRVLGKEEAVIGSDGAARLKNGTLAGSTLKMNAGLKNLVEEAQVPVEAAIDSCTANPARLLRVDNRKGKLCAGYDADIVVLNGDYTVRAVWCAGIPGQTTGT